MEDNSPSIDFNYYSIKRHRILLDKIIRNKMLVFGGIIVIVIILAAIFAPFLTKYDPVEMDFSAILCPPSVNHILGTDQFGRDIYTRILYGARISLKVGLISCLIGLIGGVFIGSLGGYIGGLIDNILMRIMDSLLAFPPILLALGLVASLGPSLKTSSVAIGVIYLPMFARVIRSSILTEREKEYVEAAKVIGQTHIKILLRHIGPNCISPVIVMATVIFAISIIIEATLSFLGVGVPPPTPSWGTMLNESRDYLSSSVYLALFPGMAISISVLSFNLLGDGLRDLLDPRSYVRQVNQ